MSQTEAVTVRLLDRDYTIGVEPAGRQSLAQAGRLLDQRMREIRGSNRTAGMDRIAVLAALNLAHEMQQLRDGLAQQEAALQRTLEDLNRRLDQALDQDPQPSTLL